MTEEDRKRWADKTRNARRSRSLKPLEELCQAPPPYSLVPSSVAASRSNVGSTETPPTANPAFKNLDFAPSPLELPTQAECIAHLKLLHAFAKLQHDVGNHDGLFGIEIAKFGDPKEAAVSPEDQGSRGDSHKPPGVHSQTLKPTAEGQTPNGDAQAKVALAERAHDKRWTVFVTKAVDRFEKWWESLPSTSSEFGSRFRTTDFDSTNKSHSPKTFPEVGDGFADMMAFRLPPLDILMVWHSYMLSPRTYLEDCLRHSKHMLWRTPFPWELIYNCIDRETFDYNPPPGAKNEFAASQPMPWDWRDDTRAKTISCPRCCYNVIVPYTRAVPANSSEAIEAYLSHDTGYAEQSFQETCEQCDLVITHEKLRVGKFIADAEELLVNQCPLPGTILNALGMPEITGKNKNIGTHDPFFPNRVIEHLDALKPAQLRADIEELSVEALKRNFQTVVTTKSRYKANSEQFDKKTLHKQSRIAVRKMLSHYWDNSTPFGLDLVGAVLRQGTFVLKMAKINWLHSPAAIPAIDRLIVKYHRFIRMIADHPQKVMVPTLDVDLAWHTHQLTPKIYYAYTVAETKKFVNHDDKIPETSLHVNFQWTSQTYEKKYGQPYSECACWYCECTREPVRSSFTNRLSPFKSLLDVKGVAERGLPNDPVNGPHVSAHNALIMTGATSAAERRRELQRLDSQYVKVRKRYEKSKREAPSKDNDAYIYSAYGYPMYYPVYVPYYADPTSTSHGDGGGGSGGEWGGEECMADGAGGWGACIPGTCSEGASMGNCAVGYGVPTCSASCGGNGAAAGGCGNCGGGGDGGGGGCGGGGD